MALNLGSDSFIDYFVYNLCLTKGGYPSFEPAMNLVCTFTANFSDNVAIKIARICSISLLIMACLFFSAKFGPITGLFFLYLNGFQTLGAYRQGTATILLCLAMYYIAVNKNRFKEAILLILSFLFHYSSFFVIFTLLFRRLSGKFTAIIFISALFFIPIILQFSVFGMVLPTVTLQRYVNLTEGSLPSSAYYNLGKIWYVIYYSVLTAAVTKYFHKNSSIQPTIHLKLYYCFIPILIAVPVLTLADSWVATRISSLTNGFELLYFILWATKRMKIFMFTAYFVRTTIAFVSFFIF